MISVSKKENYGYFYCVHYDNLQPRLICIASSWGTPMVDSRCTFYQVGLANSSTKREVMGLLQICEGFKVEAACIWRGNPIRQKKKHASKGKVY